MPRPLTLHELADRIKTDEVRARISRDVKDQATDVLNEMGLTVSAAIRMMLVRVARDGKLPFEINRE